MVAPAVPTARSLPPSPAVPSGAPAASASAAATVEAGLAFLNFLKAQIRVDKPTDLTMPQFRTLSILAKEGERGLGALAEDLCVSPAAMSKMVDALVERRLLERTPGQTDRRRIEITLTAAGRRIVDSTRANLESALTKRLTGLGAADLARLAAAMRQLESTLSPSTIDQEVPA